MRRRPHAGPLGRSGRPSKHDSLLPVDVTNRAARRLLDVHQVWQRNQHEGNVMKVQGSSAFVTGANRGLGQALVQALLERGAARVYAGARHIHKIPVFDGGDGGRVVPVPFDLTMPESILAASARAADVDLLINNASTAAFGGPLEVDRASIAQEMHVNYLGTYDTIRAFLPALRSNRGAIVNVLSLLALSS